MRSLILGLMIVVASAALAGANDQTKAKALYEQGLKHYNLAEYPEAIKAWREAYSLSKRPLLLFNIAQAYRLAGDCKLAITFYDTYQREQPNPKNQDELDAALALCAKADKPSDKPKSVDKSKPVDEPVDKPADKPKPLDKPAVADEPADAAEDGEDGEDGEDQNDDFQASSSGGGLRKVGIGVGAAGVVLGGVGILFAVRAANAASELDGFTGEWGMEQIQIESRGKTAMTMALVTGGLGIAAIGAGAVMYVIGGPKATETSSVGLVPTRDGAAFSWAFKF